MRISGTDAKSGPGVVTGTPGFTNSTLSPALSSLPLDGPNRRTPGGISYVARKLERANELVAGSKPSTSKCSPAASVVPGGNVNDVASRNRQPFNDTGDAEIFTSSTNS